ncbi:hypothetical protein ACS3SW_17215 [Roseobacteraceae bacterium S113]
MSGAPRDAAIYERDALAPGAQIEGPALIIEPQSTTLVSADFRAHLDGAGNIWLTQNTGEAQ